MDPAGSSTNPTGPDAQKVAKPSGVAVAAIQHVSLPPFWPNSPSTWFLQVEAHFRHRQITSQQTRHWHLVSCLPPDVADDLADILASSHPSHPYDTLKAAIISRKSESEHSRLKQLITATELGDRRPSQLLRRMRQLLGGPSAPQGEKLLPPPATAANPALASIEKRLDALVRRFRLCICASVTVIQVPDTQSFFDAPTFSETSATRRAAGRFILNRVLVLSPIQCLCSQVHSPVLLVGNGDDRPLTAASGTGRRPRHGGLVAKVLGC
ncbi:hypothetical protein HPB51_023768 [Rhipicephalus microplus]|uniref:DUF7041 domain-containing protein n=1 Tax=Rhipicephalus microplus TaxID=6941 RepID=A0A9J6E3V3_RHIMP|nr:hypothetical protein HPB51_023768 [Rhipicephalus microplus]